MLSSDASMLLLSSRSMILPSRLQNLSDGANLVCLSSGLSKASEFKYALAWSGDENSESILVAVGLPTEL